MNKLNIIGKTIAKAVLLTALLVSGGTAFAQQSDIQLEHKAEKSDAYTDESGVNRTRLVPAERVLPGDEVLFTVTYTNAGDEPAEEFTITNPVPEYMNYAQNTATGNNTTISFSVDNGASFAAAEQLTVANADGSTRAADAADYTHIRWIVKDSIPAGANGTVQFSAVVE